jgi:hypothetical protein
MSLSFVAGAFFVFAVPIVRRMPLALARTRSSSVGKAGQPMRIPDRSHPMPHGRCLVVPQSEYGGGLVQRS